MSEWQSLVLGLVEGVTEYLPVSSTGHLILTQHLLGISDGDAIRAFDIVIQAGAILAVLGVYARRFKTIALGVIGQSAEGQRLAWRLLIAFIPAAIAGLVFEKHIDKANLVTVSSAWIAGGVAIFGVEYWRRRRSQHSQLEIPNLTLQGALIIGVLQTLALWPGISRSLTCILGGLLAGLSFAAALEFSFLLGGITLFAAAAFKAVKYRHEMLQDLTPASMVIGLAAATLAAFVTVRWMLRSLERFGLTPFGWYRIVLGIIVLTVVLRFNESKEKPAVVAFSAWSEAVSGASMSSESKNVCVGPLDCLQSLMAESPGARRSYANGTRNRRIGGSSSP